MRFYVITPLTLDEVIYEVEDIPLATVFQSTLMDDLFTINIPAANEEDLMRIFPDAALQPEPIPTAPSLPVERVSAIFRLAEEKDINKFRVQARIFFVEDPNLQPPAVEAAITQLVRVLFKGEVEAV